MQVTKCDRCKKEIREWNDKVRLSVPGWQLFSAELHLRCAQPIVRFLKQHHIGPQPRTDKSARKK